MNSTTVRPLTHTGDSYTIAAGDRLIHVTKLERVYRVTVTTATLDGRPVGDDDRSFEQQEMADLYAAQLHELLTIDTVDVDALAAQIVADSQERTAQAKAETAQVQADVADIMAQPSGFRRIAADFDWARRQVRPTMAGAHLADLSGPQRRALAEQSDGLVRTGVGVSAATLRSLARKGYGRLVFSGRRYRIDHLVLNARGLAEAGTRVAR